MTHFEGGGVEINARDVRLRLTPFVHTTKRAQRGLVIANVTVSAGLVGFFHWVSPVLVL